MVRLVPKGHWIVVLRSGRAVRIAKSGVTFRLPLLERYVVLMRETLTDLPGHGGVTIEVPGVRLVDLRIDRIEIELTACVLRAVTAAAQTK
jgi:hypothetical protein